MRRARTPFVVGFLLLGLVSVGVLTRVAVHRPIAAPDSTTQAVATKPEPAVAVPTAPEPGPVPATAEHRTGDAVAVRPEAPLVAAIHVDTETAPNGTVPVASQTGKWVQKTPGYPLVSDDPETKGHKVVMLTFDDGPGPGTAAILDVLSANHVKALFFVTGAAFKHMDLLQREHQDGHEIGVHTMTHQNLTKLTPAQMHGEIEPLIDAINQVTGAKPKYLRPPYGAWNKDVAAVADEYHLQIINWTDGSLDWDGLDANGWKEPSLVADSVMKQLGRGAIILMHDTKKHTAEALPEVIRRIREAGYDFVVLP